MKIKVASIVFNAFTHDSRVLKEAISLQTNGYDITVIAHGDQELPKDDIVNGIKVKRFSYLDRKVTKGKFLKLKAYILYMKETIAYTRAFCILHCHDLNALPIGFIVKKFYNKNIKIVYDAHEYETELSGLKGVGKKFTQIVESFLIKYADEVITVSDSIADEYVRLYSIKKPSLVLNTPPFITIEKKDLFREKLEIPRDRTIFLYQGGLSKGRGIEMLLEAFKSVEDDKSVIVFMGYGSLEDMIQEIAKRHENIYFHDAVSPDVLLDYTSSADFGILFYENSCLNHYYCSPNKIFEYLMAEIPVIVSNLYEMKRLVESHSVGVVATDNSPDGLKEAIKRATELDIDEVRENIKKVKEIYNWQEQEKVLLKLYEQLQVKTPSS